MSISRTDFPPHFLWGAATASYQIEGAVGEDGRGVSIWDTFSHTPGKVKNGDTGDVACDHYHLYEQDLDLMVSLGLNAYRFSIAWPRIIPGGYGKVNEKGLAFYDRLVDGLLARGIQPWATLYHWDLPQVLQDKGGWENRDTIEAFLEYAHATSERLGDRVKNWITHNEPHVVAFVGNLWGTHAPGKRDLGAAIKVSHNLLVSHGRAVPIIRANSPQAQVGITVNLYPCYPATDSPEDQAAADRLDAFSNRWFLDPLYKGSYPTVLTEALGDLTPEVQAGDMEAIAVKTDFLGVNFYSRHVAAAANENHPVRARNVRPAGSEYTYMDWEVYPQGLTDILVRLEKDYQPGSIYVTENGSCYQDTPDERGFVNDTARRRYLQAHLNACKQAIDGGAPLDGYFTWSLLDNFEWAEGYEKRFGIVYVNFQTQQRTVKASGKWYSDFLRAGVPVATD